MASKATTATVVGEPAEPRRAPAARRQWLVAVCSSLFSEALPAMAINTSTSELFEQPSPVGFAQTVKRLQHAVSAAGLRTFATIDHAAAARSVGLSMSPTLVLIYGSPAGGTPLMQATPAAALDLPLRVLVRETESERVVIAFHPITPTLMRAGVPEGDARRLERAQQLLVDALRS